MYIGPAQPDNRLCTKIPSVAQFSGAVLLKSTTSGGPILISVQSPDNPAQEKPGWVEIGDKLIRVPTRQVNIPQNRHTWVSLDTQATSVEKGRSP